MNQNSDVLKDLQLEISRLRASEDNWRTMATNSPDHILTLGIDLRILDLNRPLPGLTEKELIGNPITTFLSVDKQAKVDQILRGVLETGEPALYETEFSAPGGEMIYYETRAVPRIANGKIEGLILSSRDISERIQIEGQVRHQRDLIESIFLAAPVGIGLVIDRVIAQANERLCAMVGFERDELTDQDARILYPTQEDYDFVGQEKYDQISTAGTGTVETRFQRKNGEIIDVFLEQIKDRKH